MSGMGFNPYHKLIKIKIQERNKHFYTQQHLIEGIVSRMTITNLLLTFVSI